MVAREPRGFAEEDELMGPLLEVALDLCANLAARDRYDRLLAAVRLLVPCDSAALLALRDGVLEPVAVVGLVPEVMGHRFVPTEHPRLARLLAAGGPVRFTGSDLPDPFDGLVAGEAGVDRRVHACMGAPLRVEGETVGVLAMDALDGAAFDAVSDYMVSMLGALAGAALRTARLIEVIELTCARQGLVAAQLEAELSALRGGEIIGDSPAIRRLREEITLVARSNLAVLVMGETGVGKELVARAIHRESARADEAMVYVNCAALPESIAESELFGHVRGAFTGATSTRGGKFEAADGGTLFLDEVGELPASVQPKLLRVLQSGEVQRVGSDRFVRVDVRVVAATNRDLVAAVEGGRFRPDLYHRLSVYPLQVPPLRERASDVPLLAGFFLDQARVRLGLPALRLRESAREALVAYRWPGNVRELEHVVMRAALRASEGVRGDVIAVSREHLGLEPASAPPVAGSGPGLVDRVLAGELALADAADVLRREVVAAALERAEGSWAEAARQLGMDRGNLYRLAKRLGLT